MSRFIDGLKKISQAASQPIGFKAANAAQSQRKMLLVAGLAQAGSAGLSDYVAGADAGLLEISDVKSGVKAIKEAAQMLGISDKRVYEYVDEGRLPSMGAADVIMIPVEKVRQFKRKSAGRPRKSVPLWRISYGENMQFITFILVQVYPDQQQALVQKLEEMRQGHLHIFPGTVTR